MNFLKPIIKYYSIYNEIILSARDFSETVKLARSELNINPIIIGKHGGMWKAKKIYNMLNRLLKVSINIPKFDIALSCGGAEASIIAKMRRKKAITFDDNDISPNWMYSRFVDYAFFPKAIPMRQLIKQGFKSSNVIQYEGYKEDIYIADYVPNDKFCKNLPFKDYILVRPENLMANYIKKDSCSIVPELLRLLAKRKYNILYLPRYDYDRIFAKGLNGVYIPPTPINGLDASFFSIAVLSGAGTLSREAACLGKPSISFFAGERLLSVDRQMIKEGIVFHSRDPDEIMKYIEETSSRDVNFDRSRAVKHEVLSKLDKILYH